MHGLFITFEGTEGCGKSTQINILAERLKGQGIHPLVLREPGGTPIGEKIRDLLKQGLPGKDLLPETELLLINASRAQLVREKIRPALDHGHIVLCDRFFDSSIAYQSFGRGLSLASVQRVIDFAVDGTRPDLTLFLRIPLSESERRRAARGQTEGSHPDRFEQSDREFFLRVEHGYEAIAQAASDRVRVLDATRPKDEVAVDVWKWVEPLLREEDGKPGEIALKSLGEWKTGTQP